MSNTRRFASHLANLGTLARLAMGAALGFVPACAVDGVTPEEGAASADLTVAGAQYQGQTAYERALGDDDAVDNVCSGATGRFRCLAQIHKTVTTAKIHQFAAPTGFGAPDLQAAYKIPTTISGTPTIAIVDAYGYTNLESDLAKYRAQYGLPACTTANGCLKIVNAQGQTSPLPANPPANDDWTVETALDVDMASAGCPTCKILVVQATDPGDELLTAQATAKSLGATVISDSWGGPEQAGQPATAEETAFNQSGVTIFVAAGDDGYNDAGQGPDYPGTSAYVISVGGTNLVKDGSARGWTEKAWTSGGSACSLSIPKPAYQSESPCQYKATTDVAAVGDPATGLAVYNAANGGWISVGGTSASAPLVAAIFAATGHGGAMTGAFVKTNKAMFNDVLSGKNGTCPANEALLCTAAAGWDGPTGWGTPNAQLLIGATGGGSDSGSGSDNGGGTDTTGGNGGGTGGGNGGGGAAGAGAQDVVGGCSAGGSGTGLAMVAVFGAVAVRRRRRK